MMKYWLIALILCTQASLADTKRDKNSLDSVIGREGESSEVKGEMLITASEERAIKQLQFLLKKHKGSPLEPGLWLRLAELTIRRSKTARFFEMNKDNDKVVRFAPALAKGMSSKKYVTDGIEIYERIQKQFPDFRDLDVVLFNNAFARQTLSQTKEPKALYLKLIKEFPESTLIPDSHLALGEMYYDEKAFKTAIEHFDAIRKYPDSPVYTYGLYKCAWAHYNNQDTPRGLKNLEEVVAYTRKAEAEGRDAKLDLRREALNDMVIFFSELKSPKEAVGYFKTQAGESEMGAYIVKLAQLYGRHSQHKELQYVLVEFIADYGRAPERPMAHYELITSYDTLRNYSSAVYEVGRLSDTCSHSDWSKHLNEKESGQLQSCEKIFNGTASMLATKWHKAWLKNKGDKIQADSSEKAYELYLDFNKASEEKSATPAQVLALAKQTQARYAYAELLFQREKFRKASDQYFIVSQNVLEAKVRHDSAYSALVSLEKAVGDKWKDEDEKHFTQLSRNYLKIAPQGTYANEIRFKQGFIAYEKGRYDDAAEFLKDLADSKVADAKVLKAQDIYLDILNIKKDFGSIKQYSSNWIKRSSDANRKIKLNKIYQESYFAEVQHQEETGHLKEAIAVYKQFAKDNKDSPLADKAYWNALQLEYKTGDLLSGAQSGHRFYQNFPSSAKAKEALIKAAQTFEFLGQLKEAADVLDDLMKVDTKDSEKWMSVAADFRMLSGSVDKARNYYTKLMSSKDTLTAMNAVKNLEVIERNNKVGKKDAHKKIKAMILERDYEPMASEMKLENLNQIYQDGDYKKAFQEAMSLLNDKKSSIKTRAGARFMTAQILAMEFKNQSVNSAPERVATVLAIKTEKLDKVQRAYQDVIKMGDAEYVVRALTELALCYDVYVKALRNIKYSREVPKNELEVLNAELEKVTLPMEDKAVETMSEALKQAKRLQIRDGSVAKIQAELNRLNLRPVGGEILEIRTPAMAVPMTMGDDT